MITNYYKGWRFLSILFFIFTITFLFSCATKKPDLKRFNYQIDMYNKFLVWQKFYDAEEMVVEKSRENLNKEWKTLRYTDIVVNKIKADDENKEITVIITRKFYSKFNPVLHSERVQQLWKFNDKTWLLETETILKKD